MTTLDLGALVGRVVIEDVEFQTAYTRIQRQFSSLGAGGQKAAAGTATLDESLTAAGKAGNVAAAGIGAAAKAATESATADERAAAAAGQHAKATQTVGRVMAETSTLTTREQQAVLRLTAAQDRLSAVQESGTATTRQLASAQAGLIGAQRSLVAAQDAVAASAVVAGTKQRSALAGSLKMAGELGLLIGGIEAARKAIEFVGAGKELTDSLNAVQAAAHATDQQMRAVRAQAIGMGKDLTLPRATAVDAANAILDLVRAGVSLDRAMAAARPALLLATAAQTDLAFAARFVGDTLDEFQLPADQATEVANALAAGATSAGGGLEQMFEAMKYVGPRARAVGLGVADIVAAIADLSKAGIQGSIAGTGLAMILQRIAAPSDKAKKAIADLGLEVWDAQGRFVGLPSLIDQVSKAQHRFGDDSKRFIGDISIAFGARAANLIAAFAGKGVEGYNRMLDRIKSGDVQKYADLMNRGVGAGFRQLGKEATAAGIDIYQKLEPPLASAVMWLSSNLPHAIGTLQSILGPLEHEVGIALVFAWHALTAVLTVAGSVLSGVTHFLEAHKGEITAVVTAVGSMWAAWKLYTIAALAIKAISSGLVTLRLRAMYAGSAVRSAAANVSTMQVATAGLGIALGIATSIWQANSAVAARQQALIEGYTTALEQDSNALGKHTRAMVIDNLASGDAYKLGLQLGVTQKLLTDAALGSAGAIARVKAILSDTHAEDKNFVAYQALMAIIGGTNGQIQTAIERQKNKAAADGKSTDAIGQNVDATKRQAAALQWVVTAHGRIIQVEAKSKGATDAATLAMQAQTQASAQLKQALDLLNGVNESLETSTDAFRIALGNLRKGQSLATDAQGHAIRSLNQHTVAGATNRQMLVGLIDAAKQQAQAVADSAAKHHSEADALRTGNKALKENEDAIRRAAHAAGLDKDAVDKLIASLGIIAHVRAHPVVGLVDQATSKLRAMQLLLNQIANGSYVAHVTATGDVHITGAGPGGSTYSGRYASGTGAGVLPGGWAWVGEGGPSSRPELTHTTARGTQVYSTGQSIPLARSMGIPIPGYAGGTGGSSGQRGAQRIFGELILRDDGHGGLRTYIEGVVDDRADHAGTLSRMR